MNSYHAAAPAGAVPIGQLYRNELVLSILPMFHIAGVVVNIWSPIFYNRKVVLPPPGPLLGADATVALLKQTGATASWLPPSTLDEIGKRSDLLEGISQLKYVMAGGGVVTKAAGDAIAAKTKLLNILGSTEFGPFPGVELDSKDWAYIHFGPSAGVEFRHCLGDEYELVIVRDERLKASQPCFNVFPNLSEMSTHDLWAPHPSKPDLWIYRGRSDDVIGFLNGESTNPLFMERLIANQPQVGSVLVFGQGRLEAGLLIEPSKPDGLSVGERAGFIEELWPTIQEANSQCPAYAKISKSMILFTNPQNPMARAGKGTVQRKLTLARYAAEIDALYADADNIRDREAIFDIAFDNLEKSVLEILTSATGIEDLQAEEDIFARGADSFQVIQITRLLRLALEHANVKVEGLAPSTIYINPTASKLASAVSSLQQETGISQEAAERKREVNINALLEKYSASLKMDLKRGASKRRRGSRMSVMLDRFSTSLKMPGRRDGAQKKARTTVMLTGSTGTLGSYILDTLLSSHAVSKVYCLNRTADAEQRQIRGNKARGLATEWDKQRAVFLTGDLAQKDLGLGPEKYKNIAESINVIIHNAWQVDFNLSLESYESGHIRGVSNLIDLSLASNHSAKIFFISSISSVMGWPAHHQGPVPEEIIDDAKVPQPIGYGESKHVAERLLEAAHAKRNVPISICRVGQIAGPIKSSHGTWTTKEWLPSLIISSRHLGVLPDSLGSADDVDWIPIDALAPILTQLALLPTGDPNANTVFHTVNPNITSWSTLVPTVKAQIKPEVEVVSLATWVKKLRASGKASMSKEDLAANPALKLMDFYEGLVRARGESTVLDTTRTEKACPALGEVGPVKGQWMSAWMSQWAVN